MPLCCGAPGFRVATLKDANGHVHLCQSDEKRRSSNGAERLCITVRGSGCCAFSTALSFVCQSESEAFVSHWVEPLRRGRGTCRTGRVGEWPGVPQAVKRRHSRTDRQKW